MSAGVLTIDGTAYDQASRKANSLIVDAYCAWDLDEAPWLEFHEYAAGWQPRFVGPKAVSYTDAGGVLRFTGDIVGVQPGWSDEGRTWGYRCLGLKYRANLLPVVGVDGANTMAYNLRLTDEDYLASNADKSLGDILTAAFAQHATALGAAGVATDATTTSQLATLTIVPNDPVYIQGEQLIDAIEWTLGQHAPYARLLITPDGKVRFIDTTAGASHTLTLGVDPVDPPLFSRDWTSCGTRIVVRGKGMIYPALVSLLDLDLVPAWTPAQQAAWKMADFEQPGDGYDYGTVTTTGGPTSITVGSHNGATTWAANFWSDRQAWVYLEKTTGTGLTYKESRPVTACTALTAGGTSVLTLGLALDNSATTAWDKYTLIGKAGDLSEGRNNVYRLFNVATPGNWIEKHLVKEFPQPVPFVGLNNASVQLISTPSCMVIYDGGNSVPATFRVIPSTGQILFDRPYIESINQPQDLAAGGAAVKQADDLVVLLAYSRGALEAVYPPDVSGVPAYAGTAYTSAGLQRTLYADVDSWVYQGNHDAMTALAAMLHKTRADTVVAGSVRYKGVYADVLDVGAGHKLSFASPCGATGDEALDVPVRAVTVRLNWQGGGLLATTEMQVSSRRDPRTSEGMYMHLSQFGTGVELGGSFVGAPAVAGPDSGGMGGADGTLPSFASMGLGAEGDPGRYQKTYRHSSKSLGRSTSTKMDREERAEQHRRDLEAARARSKQQGDTSDLLGFATGDAGDEA